MIGLGVLVKNLTNGDVFTYGFIISGLLATINVAVGGNFFSGLVRDRGRQFGGHWLAKEGEHWIPSLSWGFWDGLGRG